MLANLSELVVVCLMLGVFGHALSHKIRSWTRFCASMAAYQLLPGVAVKAAAGILIGLELMVVCLLLVYSTVGLLAGATLLMIYGGAMAINMLRGRTVIDCGCGDTPVQLSY